MKRIATAATALCALATLMTGCGKGERTFYDGAEYVMFADTLNEYYVTRTNTYTVDIASTVACDYDRTFGVKVVGKGSTAVENLHFDLASDNVVIKAGERSAKIEIRGHFDQLQPKDSLGTTLRLVTPENTQWELFGNETKVVFRKFCDFSMDSWLENEKRASNPEKYDYANYLFYVTFPYSTTQFTKMLVKVTADPQDDRRLIIKEPFAAGRDIKIRLYEGGPGENFVEMLPQDCIFTTDYGWVRMSTYELNPSTYNSCERYIMLYLNGYVEALGSFGIYPYALEWITEYEAEEIRNNGL